MYYTILKYVILSILYYIILYYTLLYSTLLYYKKAGLAAAAALRRPLAGAHRGEAPVAAGRYMYVCMYVCMYVYMYVCMFVCVYIYIYVCVYCTHTHVQELLLPRAATAKNFC